MATFYLDNNAIGYLWNRCNDHKRGTLASAINRNRLGLYISIYSITELLPLFKSNFPQYVTQVAVIETLINKRIFRNFQAIIQQELQTRRQIRKTDALQSPRELASTYGAIHDPCEVVKLIARIEAEKQRQLEISDALRRNASAKFLARYEKLRDSKRKPQMQRDISAAMKIDLDLLNYWAPSSLSYALPGLAINDLPKLDRLPCARAYVSIRLAFLRRLLSSDRAERASDEFDLMHYTQASYCDYLVTDDLGFNGRNAADMMGLLNHLDCPKLKVINFETFLALALRNS